MSTAPVTLDMSKATPIDPAQGVTLDLSKAVPISANQQSQQPPGFFKRLGQSLGLPTSMQEAQAMQPSAAEGIVGPAFTAGKMLLNYGKSTVQGFQDAYQETKDASENVAAGQPVLPNAQKAVGGGLRAGINAIPFLGPAINTAGEDIAAKNYSGAAGGLTGVVGQVAAPYAMEKGSALLNRYKAPLGDTVTQPRGTIPAESASPADLKAYADQNGIPLNAAQATEHVFPRNLQSAGERASLGGTAVKNQIKATQAAIAQHAQDLQASFSPNTPDLPAAGSAIQQGVQTALDQEMQNSKQSYAAIDQQANGTGVDLKPLKQTAQQILQDSSFVRKAGALDQKRASAILEDVGNLPDTGSFSDAQQLRSALLDASRSPELAISNRAQGWIKQLTGTVDDGMMQAAQSKPGLEDSFRAANDHWQQMQEDFNNPRSPLAQILQEPDPSKVPQKLIQKGSIGGSQYNAQLLDKYGIDKGPVKWSILNDLTNKDFKLYNKNLGGYGDAFLKSVFTPDELDSVYKTGAIARSAGLNTNPSGTAAVTGAMEDVRHPILSLGPKAGAAYLTNKPSFNQRLMTPGKPPFKSPLPVVPVGKKRFQDNSDIFDEGMDQYDQQDNGRL